MKDEKKVAIAVDSGEVAQHFGRCDKYVILRCKNGKIKEKKDLKHPGHKPGFLPKFLAEKGVEVILTGGIGRKAINLFERADIKIISGVKGEVNKVIKDLMEEKINGGKNLCKSEKKN